MTRRPRAIALVTHSYYEEDPRLRRQAETLALAGWSVDVFGLRRPGEAAEGDLEGVHIRCLGVQRHQGAGLATYLREYLAFFMRVLFALARAHRRRHYALVQVATLPDWLVFATAPLRALGVPVILDLHEAMPEFFRSRFPGPLQRPGAWLLRLQERASIRFADHVMTVNEALGDRLTALGVPPGRLSVIANSPSLARFDPAAAPARAFMADGSLRLVYAGAVTPMYELDVVLDALAALRRRRPALDARLDIYGRGDAAEPLAAQAARLGLDGVVTQHGRIAVEAVPAAIAAADVGLAPTRRDAFTELSLSTKIYEYAAMGKPALCSDLPLVARTFGPAAVWTYASGDAGSLADVLGAIVDEPLAREVRAANATARTRDLGWEGESARYLAVIDEVARAR
ncbi:MAG TPA: glycosyltransferase [Candidatus Sulfotelmatobacter sp.]|nr:glycosyltransferase [Candidatus Sulfotelmatobacter sp.]